jgi:hypothetical protein
VSPTISTPKAIVKDETLPTQKPPPVPPSQAQVASKPKQPPIVAAAKPSFVSLFGPTMQMPKKASTPTHPSTDPVAIVKTSKDVEIKTKDVETKTKDVEIKTKVEEKQPPQQQQQQHSKKEHTKVESVKTPQQVEQHVVVTTQASDVKKKVKTKVKVKEHNDVHHESARTQRYNR